MHTLPPCNANLDINNLDDTAFLELAASVIYIKGTPPSENKKPTLTGAIFGQANSAPLKETCDIHLMTLEKLLSNTSKATKITGLMNNIIGLAPLYDMGCTLTLEKYAAYVQYEGKTILTGWCDIMTGL